jgi:DNA primase
MISKDTISKVNEAINIVELIGDYVKLKKRGANFVGLSPFSNERTPSFTVSPVKNIFKCFSSGKAGSAVTFLMEHEAMSYPEAIKFLANKYNIPIEEDNLTDEVRETVILNETLFLVNSHAQDFYSDELERCDSALQYLGERGISDDSIKKFQLGYANTYRYNARDFIVRDYNVSEENIIKADLAYFNASNELIDKYTDRVIFPFHNLSGRITGFSGRTLKADKNIPKYTNTKENEIFHKGSILYGIFFARKAIAKENSCNIVEGQLDVISMHQHGFENTVGSGGTAITKEHLLTIKRFCSRVRFIYDGDEAGQKAIGRGIEIAVELGLSVDILVLPDKEDPDSFLLNYGAEAFSEYAKANTGDIVDFYMGDGKSISEEQKQINGKILLRLIAIIGHYDVFRRAPKVNKLHKLFNVDVRKINEAIDRIKIGEENALVENVLVAQNGSDVHELEFVKILLKYGQRDFDINRQVYYFLLEYGDPLFFKNSVARKIITDYWNCLHRAELPCNDRYIQFPDAEVSNFATNIAFEDFELSQSWEGLKDIAPNYKSKVRSALLYFRISCLRNLIEANEGLLNSCDEQTKIELIEKNKDLKESFRSLAASAGISFSN